MPPAPATPANRSRLLLRRAAQTPVVLGDRLFEAGSRRHRCFRAHGGAFGTARSACQLQLELLGQVHERLQLLIDQRRIARDRAAQRITERTHGLDLFVRQLAIVLTVALQQVRTARQQVTRRVLQLLARLLDVLRVVPERAIARIPHAAATRIGEPTSTAKRAAKLPALLVAARGVRLALARRGLLTLPGLLALLTLSRLALLTLLPLTLLVGLPVLTGLLRQIRELPAQ